ncbi:MAG: MarR family transcriptional regulator [Myxococcaceae bacterium]
MSTEPELLGWLVKRLQHRHHRSLDSQLSELGSSLAQWNALREIDRNPGACQRALAERTFNSDQAFGTLVTRLQRRGLVMQKKGEGRRLEHVLTPAGRALLKQGQKVMSQVTGESFAGLSSRDRRELARLLSLVLDGAKNG